MTALTHQTTSQSHTAPAQPTLSAKALLQSDDEALARMLLTHCSECANALMTSLLKGCDSEHPGVEALRALLMVACATTEQEQRRARNTLECMFILGTARWGRKARSEGVASFQLASQRWIGRLLQLPTSTRMRYAHCSPDKAPIPLSFPVRPTGQSRWRTSTCALIGRLHLPCGCRATQRPSHHVIARCP